MRIVLLSVLVTHTLYAGEYDALQTQAVHTHRTTNPSSLPGFVTDKPKEVNLKTPQGLDVTGDTGSNQHAKHLKELAQKRPYFVIDGSKDPIMQRARSAVQDPHAFLRKPLHNRKACRAYTYKTCLEGRPTKRFKCQKSLVELKVRIEPAKYSHYWCTSGMHAPDNPACQAKKYYKTARKYKEEVIKIIDEKWTNTCQVLEENIHCRLVKTVCPEGPEIKNVKGVVASCGKVEERPVKQKCWRYELTFVCHDKNPKAQTSECDALRHAACEQIRSICVQKEGQACVLWEQTYKCPHGTQEVEEEGFDASFDLLPLTQHKKDPKASQEMQDAIAKLSILKEAEKELHMQPTLKLSTIFKGQRRNCTIAFAGFKNCCTGNSGWGVDLKLTGCDGEERDLAQRTRKGLCVLIGTYCAQRALGACIRKKRSSCCFPSKLSRILHEQGRKQLGMTWGSAQNPNCRGFTAEELSKINFDKLDLSAVFHDVKQRMKETSENVLKRNISGRLKHITQSARERQ